MIMELLFYYLNYWDSSIQSYRIIISLLHLYQMNNKLQNNYYQ